MMFNLIPTEPLEYQIYADWLEDQGVVLTAAIRKGILYHSNEIDHWMAMGYGSGWTYIPARVNPAGEGSGSQGHGQGLGHWSLMDLAYGDANLDFVYQFQYIQNEIHNHNGQTSEIYLYLLHVPVLTVTLLGTIYVGDVPVQTFQYINHITFALIGSPEVFAVSGSADEETGELRFVFNEAPGPVRIVVSYEYEYGFQSDPY